MVCVSCGSLILGFLLCSFSFYWGSNSMSFGVPVLFVVLVLVLSPVNIFKFLLRKREWVELYIILATQLIEARAQQDRCR